MKADKKHARKWLMNCTKSEFVSVVRELMLSSEEKKLLLMKKKKYSNLKISYILHKDVSCVSKQLGGIYRRLLVVLQDSNLAS